jgi:hypothetical protein
MRFVRYANQRGVKELCTVVAAGGVRHFSGVEYGELYENIGAVCRLSYWHRRWVAQELVLAKEAVIFWGDAEFPFVDLANFLLQVGFSEDMKVCHPRSARGVFRTWQPLAPSRTYLQEAGEPVPIQIAHLRLESMKAESKSGRPGKKSLLELLLRFRETKCALSVDKVYALLSMAADDSRVPVDYSLTLSQLAKEIFVRRDIGPSEIGKSDVQESNLAAALADYPSRCSGPRRLYLWPRDLDEAGMCAIVRCVPNKESLAFCGHVARIWTRTSLNLDKIPRGHSKERKLAQLKNQLEEYEFKVGFSQGRAPVSSDHDPRAAIFLSSEGCTGVARHTIAVGDLLLSGDSPPLAAIRLLTGREIAFARPSLPESTMTFVIASDPALPLEVVSSAHLCDIDVTLLQEFLDGEELTK